MSLRPSLRGGLTALCLWTMASCSTGSPAPSEAPADGELEAIEYQVRVDEALSRFEVHMCWEGQTPVAWYPNGDGAPHLLEVHADGRKLETKRGRVTRDELAGARCFDYVLDLEGLAAESRLGFHDGPGTTALIKSSTWLWQPFEPSMRTKIRARFDMPAGMEAATSWRVDEAGVHHLDRTAYGMRSFVMLGHVTHVRFGAAEARFDVVRPSGRDMKLTDPGIQAWLSKSAEAVATLYGRFPRDRMQVVLHPMRSWGDSPSPFGMANRGGGPSIILLVNQNSADEDFIGDWSSVHEMLHFGMPFVQARDAWFSEGYASYYQEVVRARAGLLRGDPLQDESPEELQVRIALDKLRWGFERASTGRGGDTLREASRDMHQSGAYQRVYWGGAAAWAEVDLELRRATEGALGLDDLMREIWSCCAREPGVWTAEGLMEIAERKSRAWSPRAESALRNTLMTRLDSPDPPDFASCFADLGVEVVEGETRLGTPTESGRNLRTAIFSPEVRRF